MGSGCKETDKVEMQIICDVRQPAGCRFFLWGGARRQGVHAFACHSLLRLGWVRKSAGNL